MIPAGPTFGRFQPGCPSDLRFGKSPENSAPYSDEKHHSLYFIAFLSKNDKNYLFCRSSLLSLPHRRLKQVEHLHYVFSKPKMDKNRKIFAAPSAGHLHLLFPGSGRRIHPQLRAPRVVESGDRLAGCVRRHSDAGKHGIAQHTYFWRPGCKTPRATKLFSR